MKTLSSMKIQSILLRNSSMKVMKWKLCVWKWRKAKKYEELKRKHCSMKYEMPRRRGLDWKWRLKAKYEEKAEARRRAWIIAENLACLSASPGEKSEEEASEMKERKKEEKRRRERREERKLEEARRKESERNWKRRKKSMQKEKACEERRKRSARLKKMYEKWKPPSIHHVKINGWYWEASEVQSLAVVISEKTINYLILFEEEGREKFQWRLFYSGYIIQFQKRRRRREERNRRRS